jgi:O-antigen/teichoic acid export membrane protein
VGTKAAKGAAWVFSFKILERLIGFASTLILARLLVPADFGVVAMATSVIAILEVFTAFNFEMAIIQRPVASRADYDTAWTLNMLLGLGMAVVMLLAAYPVSLFYREPALFLVVIALALVPPLQNFYNIGITEYRKQLEFRPDFIFQVSKKFSAFVITIPLALTFRSYWALVAGIVGSQLVGTFVSYRLHDFRPRFSLSSTRSLLGFSGWTLIASGMLTLRFRLSHFVLGRIGGAASLGTFAMASDIATLPTTELVMPINRALFPAYARIASDHAALSQAYLAVLGVVALCVAPAAAGLIAVAPVAVPVLLGPSWAGVTPLVTPLALFGLSMALQTNSGSVYLALGRPRVYAGICALMLLGMAVLIVPLTRARGSEGAALSCVIVGVATFFVMIWTMNRLLKLRLRAFLSCLWRPTVATLGMYLLVNRYVDHAVASGTSAVQTLAGAVVMGALLYPTLAYLAWRGARRPAGAETLVASRIGAAVEIARTRFSR